MKDYVDYTTFLESLRSHDSNYDGKLEFDEFVLVLKDSKIFQSEEHSDVIFNGVKCTDESTVTYNAVRAVFENLVYSQKFTKNLAVMLFRGIDKNRDQLLEVDDYKRLIHIIGRTDNLSEKDLEQKFKNITENQKYMSYQQAMKNIFGFRVFNNENPYLYDIAYRSPHSSCCLIV